MGQPKLEYWFVVNCKSPDCQRNILLKWLGDVFDKNGNKKHYTVRYVRLSPDASCVDWEETCPYPDCGKLSKYTKEGVFSTEVDIDGEESRRGNGIFLQGWPNGELSAHMWKE
jgi:hypothetical protein